MYLLRMFIIALLFLAPDAYALDLEVLPKEVIPGDVFAVRLKNTGPSPAEAEFIGNKIDLYDSGDGFVALVAIPLNTAPGKYSVIVRQGSEERTAGVEVMAHEFRTIELTLPEGKVTLSPKNLKRAQKESKLLGDIWSRNTSMSWAGGFVNPTGTKVSTEFGLNRLMNKKRNSRHRGTDFRGKKGAPVRPINSGTVVLTDDLFFGGGTLVIDHGMGLYSIYMHLSKFNVSKGDKVSKEQVVGLVGSTGRATGPHLHMSVKLKGVSVNPESLFRLGF
jgi:murein DD-endopeptidase MepM/ murein hydrolase activator NlpD